VTQQSHVRNRWKTGAVDLLNFLQKNA